MKTKTLKETRLEEAQEPSGLYTPPQVEVFDIKLTQNILTGSLEDMPGEDW